MKVALGKHNSVLKDYGEGADERDIGQETM